MNKYFQWLFGKRKEPLQYFSAGDKVQAHTGHTGIIILVYKDIVTNVSVGCAVRWDTEISSGNNISVDLPVTDKGTKYNPVIRKLL